MLAKVLAMVNCYSYAFKLAPSAFHDETAEIQYLPQTSSVSVQKV